MQPSLNVLAQAFVATCRPQCETLQTLLLVKVYMPWIPTLAQIQSRTQKWTLHHVKGWGLVHLSPDTLQAYNTIPFRNNTNTCKSLHSEWGNSGNNSHALGTLNKAMPLIIHVMYGLVKMTPRQANCPWCARISATRCPMWRA